MLSRKRRAFAGISNLLMFPILVMLGAGMFSASSNSLAGITVNNNPVAINSSINICFHTQNNAICNNRSVNGTGSNQLTCSLLTNGALCFIICDIYGSTSLQCQNAIGTFSAPTSVQQLIFGIFNPNDSNGYGYIGLLAVAIGVVILLGITVLGTGLNPASIYIAFMIFVYVGLWLALTGLAGNVFSSMPTLTTNDGVTIQTGTTFYYMLTLLYALGVIQRLG